MKKFIGIFSFFIAFTTFLTAQIHDPVKWQTSVEKVTDTEFDLVVTANIDKGWHLYSQNVPDGGPIPTTFYFKDVENEYELVGKTTEGKGHEVYDNVFEMDIKYFEKQAIFKQRIKLLTKNKITVNSSLEFMVCDDTNCLPPTEVDIKFEITPETGRLKTEIENSNTDDKNFFQNTIPTKKEEASIKQVSSGKKDSSSKRGLWTIFIIAFFSGFAALLTPCVFPMIPMTVSFFTKQSKNKAAGIKNAIIYGVSIIIIYVLLGLLVSFIFGADALNALATNVWFNIIFFILLIVFAVSFLGAFEITLPSSWGTKIDAQADRGGMIGIFFMALALAIVSFSCTGPIVGTLLVEAAAGGNQIGPIVGMLGFSLAIALPFALFAAFPGWLNSLPKSGGWLNTVKVFLGFLE
ncbi:MAG: thiol:disulfide interchange protein, partial [Flavobacteriaceae bacterium]|nr:thiol:disulfide interchange protein [Flavobacteriaceae bacterium]